MTYDNSKRRSVKMLKLIKIKILQDLFKRLKVVTLRPTEIHFPSETADQRMAYLEFVLQLLVSGVRQGM